MTWMHARNLGFQYETQTEPLFSGVNLSIGDGQCIGLVGKNGSGKTTLLGLLEATIKPTHGELWRHPDLRTYHVKQVPEPDIGRIGDEAEFYRLAGLLGVDPGLWYRPFDRCSGGELTKMTLVEALSHRPDILVLDEPTNHLDVETKDWLQQTLQGFSRTVILVSHDRDFLDRLCTQIWWLERGQLTVLAGNFTAALQLKTQTLARQQSAYERDQRHAQKLVSAAADRKQRAQKMDRFKESRSIKSNGGLCKRDEGSGSGRANPGKLMRSSAAMDRRIERLQSTDKAYKEKDRGIRFPVMSPVPHELVLEVDHLDFHVADQTLFERFRMELTRGERLAIVGPNGCGKSTLLKEMALAKHPSVRWAGAAQVAWYQQQERLTTRESLLEYAWNPEVCDQSVARTVLGSLGLTGQMVDQAVGLLSPGQQARAHLAKIVLLGANVLLLDEPTNHLDMVGREMLMKALLGFEGTLVFVSHDTWFREQLATRELTLQA